MDGQMVQELLASIMAGRIPGLGGGPAAFDQFVDPTKLQALNRPREFAPHASGGQPFVYLGGSPFPVSDDQKRAQRISASGALIANVLESHNAIKRRKLEEQALQKIASGGGGTK
jgi:hypothetical protein